VHNGKFKRVFGLIVALLVAALFYLFYANLDTDPTYKGKRLSQHLENLTNGWFSCGMPIGNSRYPDKPEPPRVRFEYENADALDAIAKVGTNGLPMLVRMLQSKDSVARKWFWDFAQKHQLVAKLFHPKPPDALDRQISAAAALSKLGPLASPAIPQIVPLLRNPDSALVALVALASIHPEREEYILAMTNVLNIRGGKPMLGPEVGDLHAAAILTLSSFGATARGAAPILMQTLNSTNNLVQAASAVALARMGANPGKVVPVIVGRLPLTNRAPVPDSPLTARLDYGGIMQRATTDRNLALNIWALGDYGCYARPALPILSNIIKGYPLWNIQDLARQTAAKIKAGINSSAP
jgi:hypothetical protein